MSALLDALHTLGNIVDTPGSVARGLLAAPFTGQWNRPFTGILDPTQRVYGQEWTGNPWTGMAADIATDPLNILGGIGLLRAARGAHAASQANALAMNALEGTGYFTKQIPTEFSNIAKIAASTDPDYLRAMETGANLPTRNPMLKLPLEEAVAKAKSMPRDDFVFGPAKTATPPMPNYAGEMPEAVANAWSTIASRYPRTAERTYLYQLQDLDPLTAAITPNAYGNMYLKKGGLANNIWIKPNDVTPETILHELLHSAQDKLGLIPFPEHTKYITQFLEPPAWRRSIEASRAGSLYDYANSLRDKPSLSPLLAALGGLNVSRTGAYL